MAINSEKDFYRELLDVPAIPDNLLEKVENRNRRRNAAVYAAWALAAMLVMAIGTVLYTQTIGSVQAQRTAAVEAELRYVRNYLNGVTVDEEIEQYAIVDPNISFIINSSSTSSTEGGYYETLTY